MGDRGMGKPGAGVRVVCGAVGACLAGRIVVSVETSRSPRGDYPLCSVGLCAMQAGPVLGGMGGRYVSSVQFSSVQFSSVQFSSVQFSSLQFRLGQVSSVQILHVRMHACTGSRQPCAVECRMAARQRALLAAAAARCSRFARDGEPCRQALSRCRQRAAASAAAR